MIFRVLEVSGGAVSVVSVETNRGGPLGHPVSSASVSRSSGSQKSIFSGKFCKNRRFTTKGKEGKIRSKSHYEKFEI